MSTIAELAVPYAMLALHDDNVDINEENVSKILQAAGLTVEPIWVKVFVQAFKGKDLGQFLSNITSGVGAAPAPAAAAAAAPAAAASDKKEAKKQEPEEEEEEEAMGFGLFD